MPSTPPHDNKAMVPFHVNDKVLRNVYESQQMTMMTSNEPNNGKVTVPFQFGDAVVHNVNESQNPQAMSVTEPQDKLKSPDAKQKNLLPSDFTPDDFDVICSRSKEAKNHAGNVRFQNIIQATAPKYSNTEGKLSKSIIVSQIVHAIRQRSSTGRGFVKQIGGRWYELGELAAREKVSQSLRNILHSQYRSSGQSKRKMKNEMNFRMMQDLQTTVDSNEFISSRTEAMQETIQRFGHGLNDNQLLSMMTKMNCEILERLKVDPVLQKRFGQMHMQS